MTVTQLYYESISFCLIHVDVYLVMNGKLNPILIKMLICRARKDTNAHKLVAVQQPAKKAHLSAQGGMTLLLYVT